MRVPQEPDPLKRMLPYAGLKVIDMSQGIAGPVAAGLLARQGARVTKVEPPRGDWMRGAGGGREGMTANTISGNLNKRSLALDAAHPEGRAVIEKLAREADVLIENFRPGVMKKLGLHYEALTAINPALVYCSISGFGTSGPWVGKAGTDSVLQAYSGMAAVNGAPGAPPRRIGLYVPDNVTALYAAQAIGVALYARDRAPVDGGERRGTHIELSLIECCLAFQAAPLTDALLFPDAASKPAVLAPAGEYQALDGWLVAAALDDAMFTRLAGALGHAEWTRDERYATSSARRSHVREINGKVAEVIAGDTLDAWLGRLEQADVLVSPVNDYHALLEHAQLRHLGLMREIEQPPYGALRVPQLPGCELPPAPAPRVGEHSAALLLEAGYIESQIDRLIAAGVVHAMKEQ
jgi:crotonobetainyl-CoA:carnitine CoA-transferase CaiB-like acyl-CoA transferase